MNTKIFRSESIIELAKALASAQSEMQVAKKSSQNPYFQSTYATLADVWEACRAPLTKNGLSVVQASTSEGDVVSVTTILLHVSGEYISSELSLKLLKQDPQVLGSCISYLRRYGLSSIVGVVADEDDDAELVMQHIREQEQEQENKNKQEVKPKQEVMSLKHEIPKAYFYDTIEKVEKSSKSGVFFIIMKQGMKFSTFSENIAKQAKELLNQPVEIEYIEKNGYKNIITIKPTAKDMPQQEQNEDPF